MTEPREITPEMVEEARAMHAAGGTWYGIARALRVTPERIRRLVDLEWASRRRERKRITSAAPTEPASAPIRLPRVCDTEHSVVHRTEAGGVQVSLPRVSLFEARA